MSLESHFCFVLGHLLMTQAKAWVAHGRFRDVVFLFLFFPLCLANSVTLEDFGTAEPADHHRSCRGFIYFSRFAFDTSHPPSSTSLFRHLHGNNNLSES